MKPTITDIVNQKGSAGKTLTEINLGIGLGQEKKNVLLADVDLRASVTISLSCPRPDVLPITISTLMERAINVQPTKVFSILIRSGEGIDFIPASIKLAGGKIPPLL